MGVLGVYITFRGTHRDIIMVGGIYRDLKYIEECVKRNIKRFSIFRGMYRDFYYLGK